jgi:hypothetical protein
VRYNGAVNNKGATKMFKLLENFKHFEMGMIHKYELEDAIKAYNMATDNSTALLVELFGEVKLIIR